MRFVALVSGGKDSCYAMHLMAEQGHQLVALANLTPVQPGETNSYMFQTVGQEVIQLYSEALQVPLFQQTIHGTPKHQDMEYEGPVNGDEVEDLYQLLSSIRKKIEFDAISCGAIHSNYQRVRVENVCSRIGLTVFSPLWGREQSQLLREMIEAGIEAILIKTAVLGLSPKKHLGKSIREMYDHLQQLSDQFGINVCGEGGEYETLTLDCPMFHKRIVIDEQKVVTEGDEDIAPVSYILPLKVHLEDKDNLCRKL